MYDIIRMPAALEDLQHIARYTRKTWGKTRMRDYMVELEVSIALLREKPEAVGKDKSSIKSGMRLFSHRNQYYICYRISGESVELLRILHQKRDLTKAFSI